MAKGIETSTTITTAASSNADVDVVRCTQYNGIGASVKHSWEMSDGSIWQMTNPESILYNFQRNRRFYRGEA
jgi:hypothetical protein